MSTQTPQTGPNKNPSNLYLRIASALVLGVVALSVTFLGGFAFRLFTAVVGVLVFHEWTAMHRPASPRHRILSRTMLALVLAIMLAGVEPSLSFAAMGLAVLVVLLWGVYSGNGAWNAAGLAYSTLPVFALAYLRGNDHAGLVGILFLFAVVWATDICAYFVGRAVGGPKLAPSISPGKTWSGAIGGFLGAISAGIGTAVLAGAERPLLAVLLLALCLSAISQMGDLFESALKRRQGVKDSGNLIPGHGGVMDRVDGLVMAAIGLYIFGLLFSGFSAPAGFFSR